MTILLEHMHDAGSDRLPLSSMLQEYRIESVLGQGAFGITYLAMDTQLNRQVAIKEYFPDVITVRDGDLTVRAKSKSTESEFRIGLEHYLSEARMLASFTHHHIIMVHRFFEENGTAYMVMDYERGTTLGEIIAFKDERWSEQEILDRFIPLFEGVRAVHAANIVHRDIKPDNIYVRENGELVLLDFGTARRTFLDRTLLLTAIGTPAYAAPEQFSENGKQGPWTDIYAFGTLLYQMIAGRPPPCATERMSYSLDHNAEEIIVPASTKCRGNYSEHFLQAIDLALHLNREERPQSMDVWMKLLKPPVIPEKSLEDIHDRAVLDKTVKADDGSYIALVPGRYQAVVKKIATQNYHLFEDKFRDFNRFLEAVAHNWLERQRVFHHHVQSVGFERCEKIPPEMPRDKIALHILTHNGSYVLASSGCLSDVGGAFIYKKITLREDHVPKDISLRRGASFYKDPEEGKPIEVGEKTLAEPRFKTSSVLVMYVSLTCESVMEEEEHEKILDMGSKLDDAFSEVDSETVLNVSLSDAS